MSRRGPVPDQSPSGARGDGLILLGVALLLVVNLFLCLTALTMAFHIEGTDEAIAEAKQGQRVAFAAVPGLVLACLALGMRRRRALLTLLAAGCAVVAAVLVVL